MSSNTAFLQLKPSEITTSGNGCDYLGSGSYGKVIKVYTTKYGTSAAKIFNITGTVDRHSTTIDSVRKEADFVACANHENVVRFLAICVWSSHVAIIMDYEIFGSLHSLLKNQSVTVPFKLRFRMAYEIAKALKFLHNSGLSDRMVHGDLKTSNILLSEDLRIRVADFGAAQIGTKTCDQPTQRSSRTYVHSVVFTAPEFLENIYNRRTTAMDIFSYGRILHQLILRQFPFESHPQENLSRSIINGEEPNTGNIPNIRQGMVDSDDLWILDILEEYMNKCCNRNASSRPSAIEIEREMKHSLGSFSSADLLRSVTTVLDQLDTNSPDSPLESRIEISEYLR